MRIAAILPFTYLKCLVSTCAQASLEAIFYWRHCVMNLWGRYHPYCDIRSLYKLSLIRTVKSLTAKALLVIYELLCWGPGTNCYLSSLCLNGLKLLWEKCQWVIVHTTGLPQVMFYQIKAPDWPKPLHTPWFCTLTGQSKIQNVKRNHWNARSWFLKISKNDKSFLLARPYTE